MFPTKMGLCTPSLKQIRKEGGKNQQLWGETGVGAASSFFNQK